MDQISFDKIDKYLASLKKKEEFKEIEDNKEFSDMVEMMERTYNNIFITGRAGTGKSTLLRYFMRKTKKNAVVLAPTGLAALQVDGQTVHSFFKFPPSIIDSSHIKRINYGKLYKNLDVIVIDEISMVRADVLDGIDKFMRKNGNDPWKPFGGVQLIMFGDLFQLAPVVNNEIKPIMDKRYTSPYFFGAKAMEEIALKVIELKKVYRQKEEEFVNLLDLIRKGHVNEEVLGRINKRVDKNFNPEKNKHVILTTTNNKVNSINQKKLDELEGKEYSYEASTEGDFNLEGNNLPAEMKLKLKKNARVIFTKNGPERTYVNGSLGIVDDINEKFIKVRLDDDDSVIKVERAEWERMKYEYDTFNDKITPKTTGKLMQFPLRLAWALTIHKSQGQSFDKLYLDLDSGAFAHGQTYVALSRCRTLDGLVLKNPIWPSDVIIDKKIVDFFEKNRINAPLI